MPDRSSRVPFVEVKRSFSDRTRLTRGQIHNLELLLRGAGIQVEIEVIQDGFVVFFGGKISNELLRGAFAKFREKYWAFFVNRENLPAKYCEMRASIPGVADEKIYLDMTPPGRYASFLAGMISIFTQSGDYDEESIGEMKALLEKQGSRGEK
ncbi:MAG: hypothetical protein ACTSU5_04145 [Promethearchaeota archaeon]